MCVCVYVCVCVFFQSLSRVQIFMNPWAVACQAPPSVDFPGKNTEMGCHFLPGHLLNPVMEPATWVSWVSCIGRRIVYHWATREAHVSIYLSIYLSTSLHTHTHTRTHTHNIVVQLLSHIWLCATWWTAAYHASFELVFLTISSSLKPLLLLPSTFLSIRVFSIKLQLQSFQWIFRVDVL